MVGGTTFRRTVIHGEIPESWSFNLSGKPPRCFAPHRKTMPLTTPSLLSMGTHKHQPPSTSKTSQKPTSKISLSLKTSQYSRTNRPLLFLLERLPLLRRYRTRGNNHFLIVGSGFHQ